MLAFLKNTHVARLFIYRNHRIAPLSEYQLLEILRFQANKPYNEKWLHNATKKNPYFIMCNGVVKYKALIVRFE
jgi:hypothetical protein